MLSARRYILATVKRQMSAAAIERLEQELFELETQARPEIIERIARAREHGDLSENADYHAAREEQARIEGKIRELTARLKDVEVGEVVDDGIVSPGKVVSFKQGGSDLRTYLFGEREERSEDLDALSPSSPLGQAIAGRKAGEKVQYEAPAGKFEIEIVEVRPVEV